MADRLERIGMIVKIIANSPGIKLAGLLGQLKALGVQASEKTVTSDIAFIKEELKLLPAQPRLRGGYLLADMQTIGEEEIAVVIDALSAFGVNLNDLRALEISRRLASNVAPGLRGTSLRQRNIYKKASSHTEIDEILFSSIRNKLAVNLQLESPNAKNPVKLSVFPLFRVFHERGWYLITKDVGRSAYFPCRVDRIRKCEIVKPASVNDAADQDMAQAQYLMNCGWGMDFPHSLGELAEAEAQPEIIVRFDRSIADFIREGVDRHPRAKIVPSPDGSGCLDFHIQLKYHNEFKHWVRSWASKAWFVAPQNMVDDERLEIRRKMVIYSINGAPLQES